MYIIGITGRNGSGKDTVADYLERACGVTAMTAGDLVRDLAEQQQVEPTRENLHRLSQDYLGREGPEALVKEILRRARRRGLRRAAIVGLRSPEEVNYLRGRLQQRFLLAAVIVGDARTRYERSRGRGEARDALTFEQFRQQDRREHELFGLERTLELADIRLDNGNGLDHLYQQIDAAVPAEFTAECAGRGDDVKGA